MAAKVGTSKRGGKQWQTTRKNLPRNVAYQSHTGRLTGLWFLPKLGQGLNTSTTTTTNNNNSNNNHNNIYAFFCYIYFSFGST